MAMNIKLLEWTDKIYIRIYELWLLKGYEDSKFMKLLFSMKLRAVESYIHECLCAAYWINQSSTFSTLPQSIDFSSITLGV